MGAIEDLIDVEAIKNVRIMYAQYFDGQEMDKLADLFTEDAICEFDAAHGSDTAHARWYLLDLNISGSLGTLPRHN